jgi:hypothetical protein
MAVNCETANSRERAGFTQIIPQGRIASVDEPVADS